MLYLVVAATVLAGSYRRSWGCCRNRWVGCPGWLLQKRIYNVWIDACNTFLLLLPGSFSPKAYPVIAVKAKLRELATGTATVMLALWRVHTYSALPHWFSPKAIQYLHREPIVRASWTKFLHLEPVSLTDSIPWLPRRMNGLVTPHNRPTARSCAIFK